MSCTEQKLAEVVPSNFSTLSVLPVALIIFLCLNNRIWFYNWAMLDERPSENLNKRQDFQFIEYSLPSHGTYTFYRQKSDSLENPRDEDSGLQRRACTCNNSYRWIHARVCPWTYPSDTSGSDYIFKNIENGNCGSAPCCQINLWELSEFQYSRIYTFFS